MKRCFLLLTLPLLLFGCGEETSERKGLSTGFPREDAIPYVEESADPPAAVPVIESRQMAAGKPSPRRTAADKVVAVARGEVARGKGYDPAYYAIKYPGGDVPGGGACTDLVVRALRAAGHDLQKLVHEDKRSDLNAYPHSWKRHKPDTNIDHRRVANLICFMKRRWQCLPDSDWQPGDIVFWSLGASGRKHCGIISDRKARSGLPLVIHNISGASEEDCLRKWKVIGHARCPEGKKRPAVARKAITVPAVQDDQPKG